MTEPIRVQEIAQTLSDDEYSCLMIAQQGGNPMAIARWEQPINALVQKGLLNRIDQFNHTLSHVGREVLTFKEKQEDTAYAQQTIAITNKIADVRSIATTAVEQAAQHLVMAAKTTITLDGLPIDQHIKKWAQVAIERALQLVKE